MTMRILGTMLLLAALALAPSAALATTEVEGTIACGNNSCLNTWNFKCNSPMTRCIHAEVEGPGASETFVLTVGLYFPLSQAGVGSIEAGSYPEVLVCRTDGNSGPTRAVVPITVRTWDASDVNYTLVLKCLKSGDENDTIPTQFEYAKLATDQTEPADNDEE
jgi:hypothetical protein